MSSATSPGPNNLLLLAVLGIGAYYLMTRRAVAMPVYSNGRPTTTTQERVSLLAAGSNLLRGLFNGVYPTMNYMGTSDGRSQTQWDVTPQGSDGPRYNNPSAYVSGGNDGLAVNPPNSAPYDWLPGEDYWM